MAAYAFAIPLRTRFRGITVREGVLLHGPCGWGEFSPFLDYGSEASARWLAACREATDEGWPAPVRPSVPVNVTVPAVEPARAQAIVRASGGCRTAKVKVGEPGQSDGDDLERVQAVREALGPGGAVRVDANGAWDVPRAVRMIRLLDRVGLQYVEQPCRSLAELAAVRRRVDVPVAADEAVRLAADPTRIAGLRAAADIVVLKVQPLGGVRRALRVAEAAGLPVVVSGGPDVVRLLQRHGLTPRPICVDEAGLRPETIPAGTAAVIVRPEHQLPLSVQMPLDRRRLVDAAVDTGFMLVEDDRDHEFSGTLQPPSIWELTRGRTDKVASFGCLCRLLPQELCIGYVLARGARLQDLRHLAALRQSVPPAMVVRAATELLHSVEFHRRLRRLRRICTNKRRMILEGLAGHPQVMRIHGHSSGSHVYVELVGNRSAEDTARALSRHRINAPTTRRYDWAGSRTGNGLIIGHNQLTEKHLAGAVRLIGRSLDAG